jgi:thiol-disulfide isomerase/thioredoxin
MNAMLKSFLLMVLAAGTTAHAYEPEIGELPGPIGQLEYVDGIPLDVSALRGKPLVLYFGADWCVPCVERGRPATVKVAKRYGPMGLQVIFVSMDDNKFRQQKIDESKNLGLGRVIN